MIQPSKLLALESAGDTVGVSADRGCFRLTPYATHIVHVAYFPDRPVDLPMWGIRERDEGAPACTVQADDAGWSLHLTGLRIRLHRATAEIEFRDARDAWLTSLDAVGLTPVQLSGENTHHVHGGFRCKPGGGYYGLGQHQNGWMDHDHREVRLWHDYKAAGGEIVGVPFLLTRHGYAVLWDNPSRSAVMPGGSDRCTWRSEVGDAVSFFLLAGDDVDTLFLGLRLLTGATPLPPLAALGYIQCKQRYTSRDELMEVARTYRAKGYPCDILVVDWFHWKTLGDMDLDPEFWPDPASMNRELQALGYRVMISCWPRFMKASRYYRELEAQGWFMHDYTGETVYGIPEDQRGALIDTTHPDCARWYWRTIRQNYGDKGFSSWWLDEDEPDISPHPFHLHAGPGSRVHNLYPLTHCRAVYEGHRRDRRDRCLILSRSAYLGAQTTGATFWSSDIHPTWDVFRRQIPCGLNMCASGFAWWSSDIGGWQSLKTPDESVQSLLLSTNDATPSADARGDYVELYIRWFQYGAFCPTFRAHGSRPENEVWSYGAEAERILVAFLRLRYRLLPYIYSLAWRTTRTGAPFMRAMFMDFGQDPMTRDLKTQYLFGPAFLVAPVCEPGATSREVYLPASCGWTHYWTGEHFDGGRAVTVEAPIDRIPLFVRDGSIVPMGEAVPYTAVEQERLELHVYPGRDAEFVLYRDDGTTYAYEHGEHRITHLRWDDQQQALTVTGDEAALFENRDRTVFLHDPARDIPQADGGA